jgi:ectoine hydroxylase-related dioxygenase (phytanoyl-CoA dioxygenase family)
MSHRFTPEERAQLAEDGYVVRRHVFDARDCGRLAADCEALIDELQAARQGPKHVVGSYMFEMRRELSTVVKWEPFAPELVQGVEFFLHLSPSLARWAADPRLTDPAKDLVGEAEVIPFTEKLNVKRAKEGGRYTLHQDASYWSQVTPLYRQIATAMVLMDDATVENGCLEVAPGSHKAGKLYERRETPGFGSFEMDEAAFDEASLTPVEAPAGSVIFFGSFLVHRSAPNVSANDRRALLLSYQPAGNPHSRELERPAVIRALA